MLTRNPHQSIDYAPDARPTPALVAGVAWTGFLYLLPLLPAAYFLVLPSLYSQLLPFRIAGLSPLDLAVVTGGIGLLSLLRLGAPFFLGWFASSGEREQESRDALLGMSDSTGVEEWDRVLTLACPLVAMSLLLLRLAGPLELLLVLGVALTLTAGSRKLSRFPVKEPEPRLTLSDAEIREALENTDSSALTTVHFAWRFQEQPGVPGAPEQDFAFSMPFDRKRYEAALAKPHEVRRREDYARFVLEDLTCPELCYVAARIREVNEQRGYTPFQKVGNVLAFCKQFDYAYDFDTKGQQEYPRYPVEMLWDREGDCQCHAILAAALLHLQPIDTVLLYIRFKEGPGHMAVGVAGADDLPEHLKFYERDGRCYFYCEATPAQPGPDGRRKWSWQIGELPFEEAEEIYPIRLAEIISSR